MTYCVWFHVKKKNYFDIFSGKYFIYQGKIMQTLLSAESYPKNFYRSDITPKIPHYPSLIIRIKIFAEEITTSGSRSRQISTLKNNRNLPHPQQTHQNDKPASASRRRSLRFTSPMAWWSMGSGLYERPTLP